MEHNPDTHSLQCPKCGHGMEEVSHDNVTIDRCTHCEGLWFDADEAHLLKGMEGSAYPGCVPFLFLLSF